MAQIAWLNKIFYHIKDSTDTTKDIEYKVESTFDQIKYNTNARSYTLKSLADSLETFFKKKSFMHYSNTKPADDSTTVEWYCLEDNNYDSKFND